MIMVKIGVTIISTVNAIAIYSTFVVLRVWACQMITSYRLCPKSTPNRCFGKNVAIISWMGSYATIASITKTMLFPKEKAWIGSPIIVIDAKQSDVYLNKSPIGNGRNPYANDEPQTMWAWNPISNDHH